jgi:hypothetical protein
MLGGIVKGALAGAAGTLAMDLVWYSRYRSGGGDQRFAEWEFSTSVEGYEEAPAPAKVAELVANAAGVTLPDETAGLANNVVHWATGVQWGAGYGMAAATASAAGPALGLVLGPVAWGTSYAVLAPLGIYRPIWDYDTETLWKDLSAHLVFGVATATVFRALTRRR